VTNYFQLTRELN